MAMFVVKSILIQIYVQVSGFIMCGLCMELFILTILRRFQHWLGHITVVSPPCQRSLINN